jgi:hypothetical protein
MDGCADGTVSNPRPSHFTGQHEADTERLEFWTALAQTVPRVKGAGPELQKPHKT